MTGFEGMDECEQCGRLMFWPVGQSRICDSCNSCKTPTTDDARLQRLTELARKVWPEQPVGVRVDPQTYRLRIACAEVLADPGVAGVEVYGHRDDIAKTLDALEAALCVLANEPPPQTDRLNDEEREFVESARKRGKHTVAIDIAIVDRLAPPLLAAAKGKP
jgi:hypothetical protein